MSKFTRKLISSVAPIVNTPGVWTVNERTQNSTALVITSIVVCDSGYNELDDTAVGTSGGYLKIKGTGFLSTATVYLNGVLITPTVTSSLELRITVPTLTVGTYSLIVFNTAAVGAIWAAGLVISGFPVWSTTTIATANLAVNTQLVASGDATLVYTLASGSLPPGVTLSSGGLLSGTISPVPTVNTVYNFTVDVKDAQNQNLAQAITFSLSVEYFIKNSLRFRPSASAYLNRTPATATNRTTWTWSAWVKRGTLGVQNPLFFAGTAPSDYTLVVLTAGDGLGLSQNNASASTAYITSSALFRDPAAWYHIVAVWNSTSATATLTGTTADRMQLWVNGVQLNSFSASLALPQNTNSFINSNVVHHHALYPDASPTRFDGEMAEVNFVDGQALAPTAFGAYSTYNQWLPKAYTGTYGTNGFYLPFSKGTTASYAALFNGSTQYLATPSNQVQIQPGTSNFTIEFWFYLTSAPPDYINVFSYGSGGDTLRLFLYVPYSLIVWTGSTPLVTANNSFTINTWNHVAIVRSGTTLTMYVNGASVGNNTGNSTNYTGSLTIGFETGQPYYPGRLSNFRIVKGTAVYTANFAPPTEPLTAITNTSLLTLQNATIVDNSTNVFTITNNGAMVTSVQSPFLKTTLLTSDSSGNANNWTPNNISIAAGSTYDLLTDVPTLTSSTAANYCVLNPLSKSSASVLTNGNLTYASNTTAYAVATGTIQIPATGKWYFEARINTLGFPQPGYHNIKLGISGSDGQYAIDATDGSSLANYTKSSPTSGAYDAAGQGSSGTNDTMMVAYDAATGKLWLGAKGYWVGGGNPSTGTTPTYTTVGTLGSYFPRTVVYGSSVGSINFGQQPFTYTPPTNFLALNTYNI